MFCMTLWVCSTGSLLAILGCIIKILRTLTAQPDNLPARGDNGLAQIIIEILFRIGIGGIKFANAFMGHDAINPKSMRFIMQSNAKSRLCHRIKRTAFLILN